MTTVEEISIAMLLFTVIAGFAIHRHENKKMNKRLADREEEFKNAVLQHKSGCTEVAKEWYQVSEFGQVFVVKLCESCNVWRRTGYVYKDSFKEAR